MKNKNELTQLANELHAELTKLLAKDLKPQKFAIDKKPAPPVKKKVQPNLPKGKGDLYKSQDGKTLMLQINEHGIVLNGVTYTKQKSMAETLQEFRTKYLNY